MTKEETPKKKATTKTSKPRTPKVEKEKVTVVDIVVDKVLKYIEENKKLPWDKPWQTGLMNWYSEREYRGINVFLLGGSGEYITMNQLIRYNKEKGTNYRVKPDKLKHSQIVVLYKPVKSYLSSEAINKVRAEGKIGKLGLDDKGFYEVRFILRYYRVYDIEFIEDEEGNKLESKFTTTGEEGKYQRFNYDADALAKTYMGREGITFTEEYGQRAFYRQKGDIINMPRIDTFVNSGEYYKTLYHEMVHSTGVEFRLNRKWFIDYHDAMETRGVEELIAELGGCLLLTEAGFKEEDMDLTRTEAYLLGWSSWIKDNKQAFLTACTYATKAMDYILHGKDAPPENESDDEE